MSFLGADTDELRDVGQKFQEGKETIDEVIAFLKALIALLKAASFFSGGASAAYAQYLESVVVPWLMKISQALGLMSKVLTSNAEAQDQASQGNVATGSLPTYTSQIPAGTNTAVTPYTGGSILGGANPTAALGAIAAIANQALGQSGTQSGSQAGGVTSPTGGLAATTTLPGSAGSAGSLGSSLGGSPGGSPGGTLGSSLGGSLGSGTSGSLSSPVTASALTHPAADTMSVPQSATSGLGSSGHGLASMSPSAGGTLSSHALSPLGGGTAGHAAPLGSGGGSSLGGGSLGGSSIDGHTGAGAGTGEASTLNHGTPTVHALDSTAGHTGGGTPGGDSLAAQSPLAGATAVHSGTDAGGGTSYGTAGALAGGAAAMGVGGAALAAVKGSGGADSTIDTIAGTHGRGSSGAEVRELQQRLTDAGYDTHGVDGQWGGNTERAYEQYRAAHPLPIREGTGFNSPDGFDYNQVTGIRGNDRVTPEFLRGVEGVAQRTGAKPEQLLAAMSFETGGTFDPAKVNARSGATGLIQFMPDTAAGFGTSTTELARMTPTQQLPYVEQYLNQYRGRIGDVPSLYSSILGGHPMAPDHTMFTEGTATYTQNRELDLDHNGRITVSEAASQIERRLAGR